MRDLHFKYQVGDLVTHVGFLKPMRQPVVQRFEVRSQTLVEGPGCTYKFYYVHPVHEEASVEHGASAVFRVQEEHLAPLPEHG